MDINITTIEKEILYLLSIGDTRKEIARKLNISYYLCRQTLNEALKKLNARNGTHGVILALRRGFIK